MNKIQLYIFSVLFLVKILCGQTDDPIKNIKNEYARIKSSLNDFTIDSLNLSVEYSTDGGIMYCYSDENKKAKLLSCDLYGESGKSHSEYYIDNDSLFFLFQQSFLYNSPYYMITKEYADMGFELFDPGKTRTTEDRFYFFKGKLIRWIDEDSKIVNSESAEFKKKEKDILDFYGDLLKYLNPIGHKK
jgi:hypothetical protein